VEDAIFSFLSPEIRLGKRGTRRRRRRRRRRRKEGRKEGRKERAKTSFSRAA